MDISKLSLAYFSPTLSTKRIVLNTAQGLALKGTRTVDLNLTGVAVRERSIAFGTDELLVIGVPTYGGRLPKVSPTLLENFTGENTPALMLMVYGNRGYDDALLELRDELIQHGFVPIAGAAIIAEHANSALVGAGRPDFADIRFIQDVGRQTRLKLDAIDAETIGELPQLTVPGAFPYKELPPSPPMAPVTNNKCILCMQCYRWCPTDAIHYNNPEDTNPNRCIKCRGCVKRCPVDAREFVSHIINERVAALEAGFADKRTEPEIFL